MTASELEQIWKTQPSLRPSQETIADIATMVAAVDRKFRRKLWWRDLREIGAAISGAIVFGLAGQTWLRWISVLCCLFVAVFLIRSRTAPRSTRETPTVVARLQQMICETETQIQLLRSVLWWYLLPCGIATFVFVLDRLPQKFSASHLLNFTEMMIALYLAIYWLNQRAVRKVLEPRRKNLQRALAELS
jgi:hypothetical protein